MEIAFSPGGVSRDFRIKSTFLQMSPDCVHIRDVENQPPPASHPVALFQIEHRRLCVLCAQRRETRALSTIEKVHAYNISIKPPGLILVHNPQNNTAHPFNPR